MKRLLTITALALTMIGLQACFSSRTVQRIDPDTRTDLSGRWNDEDSRQVADAITGDILGARWKNDFMQTNNGKRPVLIVGLVRNKSHEHISAETFIKDLERAIINNGSIRLVQAGDMRDELRAERADQQEFASPETTKKWGRELGADYILQGSINSIVDEYGDEKAVYYQVDLELTDLETNEKVWMGYKKIKKFITN